MFPKPKTFRPAVPLTTALLSFLFVFTSHFIFAQSNSNVPVSFPVVNLVGSDGKAFNSAELLSKEKPTIVVYFSPTCGACEEQIKTITSNMADMAGVQFLFVTSYAPADTEPFLEDQRIGSFGNIRFGYDTKSAMGQHYQLEKVPAVYFYNAEGKLQQEWNGFASAEIIKAAVDGKSLVSTPINKENVNLLEGCPEPDIGHLGTLCVHLVNNSEDEDTGIYKYILTLRSLACVADDSSEEVTKLKIQAWWAEHATKIKCNLKELRLADHNILKYAVSFMRKHFIRDLVEYYDVDINYKDPKDGKTVIEFCHDETDRIKNSQPFSQNHLDSVVGICEYLDKVSKDSK